MVTARWNGSVQAQMVIAIAQGRTVEALHVYGVRTALSKVSASLAIARFPLRKKLNWHQLVFGLIAFRPFAWEPGPELRTGDLPKGLAASSAMFNAGSISNLV